MSTGGFEPPTLAGYGSEPYAYTNSATHPELTFYMKRINIETRGIIYVFPNAHAAAGPMDRAPRVRDLTVRLVCRGHTDPVSTRYSRAPRAAHAPDTIRTPLHSRPLDHDQNLLTEYDTNQRELLLQQNVQ